MSTKKGRMRKTTAEPTSGSSIAFVSGIHLNPIFTPRYHKKCTPAQQQRIAKKRKSINAYKKKNK